MFGDENLREMSKSVRRIFWRQIISMWPIFLVWLLCVSAAVSGLIWLLLYILDTYVGKA